MLVPAFNVLPKIAGSTTLPSVLPAFSGECTAASYRKLLDSVWGAPSCSWPREARGTRNSAVRASPVSPVAILPPWACRSVPRAIWTLAPAVLDDHVRVAHRFSIHISPVSRKQIDDVSKFVQNSGYLRLAGISRERPDPQITYPGEPPYPAIWRKNSNVGGSPEECAPGIQFDGLVRAAPLHYRSHIRIAINAQVRRTCLLHIIRCFGIDVVGQRFENVRGMRIFRPKPCRACILSPQNLQRFIPRLQDQLAPLSAGEHRRAEFRLRIGAGIHSGLDLPANAAALS